MFVLCRDTTELITDEREGALTGTRRALYKFHLMLCPYCRRYVRQMDATVEALAKIGDDEVKLPPMESLISELQGRAPRK